MAATYLQLTNELLRELNEVSLTSATFTGAIGIQQHVKDCVNPFTRLNFDANRLTIFGKGHIPVAIGIKLRAGCSIWKLSRCHHFIAVLIIAMKNCFIESILGRYGRKQENGE